MQTLKAQVLKRKAWFVLVNIGKKQKVKPGDILGAVAGESKMPGKLVGCIDMFDNYTFVEVPRNAKRCSACNDK